MCLAGATCACAVGVEADSASVSKLLSELEGKNLEEVISQGREKLASVPSGGGVAAAAPAAGGAAPAAAAAPKKEEKKEPTEEEVRPWPEVMCASAARTRAPCGPACFLA